MVAPSTPGSRVVASVDGRLGCLVSGRELTIIRLPSLERDAEIGVGEDAEVTMVGQPTRVVVLAASGVMHVVDPHGAEGPTKLGDISLQPGTRILGSTADHVFVQAANGTFVVELSQDPMAVRIAAHGAVSAIGACATPGHFVACVAGVLEEWSVPQRAPLRRFRLEKPINARYIGGNSRHIWALTDRAANEIVLVPLASARPAKVDLPEPAARVVPSRLGNHLAIVGAERGAVYIVNLADFDVRTIHPGPADDVAWVGPDALLTVSRSVLELVALPGVTPPRPVETPIEVVEPAPKPQTLSTHERLAMWKARARGGRSEADDSPVVELPPPAPPSLPATPSAPLEPLTAQHQWRDAVAAWARRFLNGQRGEPPLIAAGPLHDVTARLGLNAEEAHVVWLLYGARLCGENGVAPVDIAALAPQRWADALGHTALRTSGALTWRYSRVLLTREVVDALDERSPRLGTVIESALPSRPPLAVVAPPDKDLAAVADMVAAKVGPMLLPNAVGLVRIPRLLQEARVRALAPIVPLAAVQQGIPPHAIVVVREDAEASGLGLEQIDLR